MLLLLVLFCQISPIQAEVRFDQSLTEFPVYKHSEYLWEDAELEADKILSGQADDQFKAILNPNFGFSTKPIWLRLSVANSSPSELEWVLKFPYTLLDKVNLHYFDQSGKLNSLVSGDGLPSLERSQFSSGIVFFLKEAPESHRVYYIQIQTGSSLQLAHHAFSKVAYQKSTLQQTLVYGVFFGSFIVMGIYNLSIAFSIRSRQYLFYSLLMLLSVFREGYLAGMTYEFLWPNHPKWNEYVGIYSMAFTIYLANIFVMDFLEMKAKAPWQYRLLQLANGFAVVYMILFPVLGYSAVIRPISVQVVLNSIVVFLASLYQLKQGYRAARFLALAWTFILGGFVISAISAYGVIPASVFTQYANPLGQFFEIIFLSFALSDRINTLRRDKNNAILALNKGLEKEVHAKTQDIQSILDSIPLGILKLDGQGRLKKGHSKFMDRLITDQRGLLDGLDIRDVLLKNSNLNSDEISLIMTILEAAVGEDEIQWSFNCELLPKNLVSDGRNFELIWTPVLSADQGVIQDVLLVIKDVTELRAIVIENERSQRENEIILQIIKTRSKDFQTFVANSYLCLDMVHKVFFRKDSLSRTEDINEIWRRLHTLKGVSRGLGFRDISAKIHDAESCLREVEGQTAYRAASLERFKAIVLSLEADLLEYKRIDHDVLKRDLNQGFDVSSADIAQQVAQLEAALELPVIRKDDLLIHLHDLKSLYQDSFEKVAHSQIQNLQKIAEGAGKPLPSLMIKGSRHFLDDPIKEVMDFVLMHLFRNSLDHGIEEPAERLRNGKAIEGTIALTLQNNGQKVQIIYKDDGRGLDLAKVRTKALEMELIRPDAQLSALDIANLVWLPGFSTAERVTEISGRGVGMDAVRNGLEKIGGRISIVMEEPGFHFVIELPKNASPALPPVSRAG